jgi:hypothetical protein
MPHQRPTTPVQSPLWTADRAAAFSAPLPSARRRRFTVLPTGVNQHRAFDVMQEFSFGDWVPIGADQEPPIANFTNQI